MFRHKFLVVGTSLIVLLLAACRSTTPVKDIGLPAPVAQAELRNTRWVVHQLHNHATITPESGEVYLLLRSPELQAEGHAGCNRFRASFALPGTGELLFGPLVTTRMACADAQGNAIETSFLATLAQVRTYQIKGDTLRLYLPTATEPTALLHAVYLR
jgi:heat shock protein HslJ